MNQALTDKIRQLELKLLHSDKTITPAILDRLLAAEFEEIGGNGAVSQRQDVVNWLLHKNPQDRWLLTDFRVKELSEGVVLAVYHAQKISGQLDKTSKGSVRSSIWKRNTLGWQMMFHQASKIF